LPYIPLDNQYSFAIFRATAPVTEKGAFEGRGGGVLVQTLQQKYVE
jgi:hypothetical protein